MQKTSAPGLLLRTHPGHAQHQKMACVFKKTVNRTDMDRRAGKESSFYNVKANSA